MSSVRFISSRFHDRRTLPASVRMMRRVSVAGIALAVAALVVATAIGRGFEERYRSALLDFNAHVIILGGGETQRPEEARPVLSQARFATPDEARKAKRWGWLLPWREGAHRLGEGATGFFFTVRHVLANLVRQGDEGVISEDVGEEEALPIERAESWWARIARGEIVAETPFLYREALAIGGGQIAGVVAKGIDPATMAAVNAMPIQLFEGRQDLGEVLARAGQKGVVPVIVGQALAEKLGLRGASEEIRLLIPQPARRGGGGPHHPFERVRVVGTFASGMHDYDAQFLLMAIPEARKLFGVAPGVVTGIELRLNDPERAAAMAEWLEERLGPRWTAVTWSELNRELFSAVRLEQLVSSLIMGIMVVVAALNIVAVIVLITVERVHEMSILRALGLRDAEVRSLLARGGMGLGLTGALAGLAVGTGLAAAIGRWQLIPLEAEIYLVGALPIDISPTICGMITLFCFGVGALTSHLAAGRLRGIPVREGLQVAR